MKHIFSFIFVLSLSLCYAVSAQNCKDEITIEPKHKNRYNNQTSISKITILEITKTLIRYKKCEDNRVYDFPKKYASNVAYSNGKNDSFETDKQGNKQNMDLIRKTDYYKQ